MVKDWTLERKEQLRKLQSLLYGMERVNRTTGAIDDIIHMSKVAKTLCMRDDGEDETFWNFLCMELNKDAS